MRLIRPTPAGLQCLNNSSGVNDGACERVSVSNEFGTTIKPCPSFEQITVVRKKRRRYTLPHMALDKLPEPQRLHAMNDAGAAWRVHLSGVHYHLYYRVLPEAIEVLAFWHTSRGSVPSV